MGKNSKNCNTSAGSNGATTFITKVSAIKPEDIKIDEKFSTFLSPLSPEREATLAAKMGREGPTDALYVLPDGTLIDGHHRFKIWERDYKGRSDMRLRILEVDIPDEKSTLEWMLQHQNARRNQTPAEAIEVALKLKPHYEEKAANQKRGGVRLNSDGGQSPVDVLETIAKLAGTSRDSVAKVQAVLRDGTSETIVAMRAGELSINAAYIQVTGKTNKSVNRASSSNQQDVFRKGDVIATTAPATEDGAEVSADNGQADENPRADSHPRVLRDDRPRPPSSLAESVDFICKSIDDLFKRRKHGDLGLLHEMKGERKRLEKASRQLVALLEDLNSTAAEASAARAG